MKPNKPKQRTVLCEVPDSTNEFLLRQNLKHCIRTQKILSAAKIARALLTACAIADVQLADLDNEQDLTAWVADIFRHAAQTTGAA